MLNITIIHVGSFKERYFDDAFSEYSKRISAFAKFEDVTIKERLLSDSPAAAEIEKALEDEGKEILARFEGRSKKIALCVEGRELSSEGLAALVAETMVEGFSRIIFVIGSSYGLSNDVKRACDLRLSFSKMTFPHQLMRVILAEQIYRAFTINKGTRYHK